MRFRVFVALLAAVASPAFAKKVKDFKVFHNSVFIYHPTGPDISYFRVAMTVPAEPATTNGQDVAMWSGLEPEDSKGVLQPVLQWGTGWANGGSWGWSLACWGVNIDATSEVTFKSSKLASVKVGDRVTAVMQLISRKNGVYTYKCYFEGHPETELIYEVPSKLNTAWLEYEIQDVTSCGDYADNVTFTEPQLMAGETNIMTGWQKAPVEDPLNCGMKMKASKNGRLVSIGTKPFPTFVGY